MPLIGLISDTHGFLDPQIHDYFADCDEVWHAGDFGSLEVVRDLQEFKPLRGVFGNIDDAQVRDAVPQHLRFDCGELSVWMTHIGGRPERWDRRVAQQLQTEPPGLFICGHTHLVVAHRAQRHGGMVHLNPGAAGHEGSHLVRTAMRFRVAGGQVEELKLVELGTRGRR